MAKVLKGPPFSIRLSKPTETYVEAEARRTRRSKSAVVEDLTEEAARMRRYPGIEFIQAGDGTRRARLRGTGMYVWLTLQLLEDLYGNSIDDMVADYDLLTKQHLQLALAYYSEYPDEIDEPMAENRRPVEERRELYPFIQVEYFDAAS